MSEEEGRDDGETPQQSGRFAAEDAAVTGTAAVLAAGGELPQIAGLGWLGEPQGTGRAASFRLACPGCLAPGLISAPLYNYLAQHSSAMVRRRKPYCIST